MMIDGRKQQHCAETRSNSLADYSWRFEYPLASRMIMMGQGNKLSQPTYRVRTRFRSIDNKKGKGRQEEKEFLVES